ncbi:MAG: TonB family protein, partial [Candidatus Omnitrophica bacterium]|nr:TonB family protein [Candidatus Omnitrophota bacterium]
MSRSNFDTKKGRKTFFAGVFLFFCAFFTTHPGFAEKALVDSLETSEIHMLKGEVVNIRVYSLSRISVSDPEIADIHDADDQELTVVAHNQGQTPLFIWDEHGKRTIMIYVLQKKLDLTEIRIKNLLKAANIHELIVEQNEKEGKIVLVGEIPPHKKDQFDLIVNQFDEDLVNLVKDLQVDDLIEIDMQVTELSTTLTKSLGINWSAAQNANDSSGSSSESEGGGGGFLNPRFDEDLPDSDGSFTDLFKVGDFRRTSILLATVNALLEEGKARILSKPKLVTKSGEEAKFLVGGEVPVRQTTVADNGTTIQNTTYKEYGISMTITPTIVKEKIDIDLNMSISDLDPSNAVGQDVAFLTRSAQTKLYLDDGQTIVLAGLIRELESETVKKVPFLGNIPIVGLMFRSRETPVPNTDSEVVISLTPRVLVKNREFYARDTKLSMEEGKTSGGNTSAETKKPSTSRPYYSGIPREMREYVENVQRLISSSIVYPREAREYGWEGTVKVGLLILRDGTLAYALIKESSGYEIFDEYALNTAKNTAPFSTFP